VFAGTVALRVRFADGRVDSRTMRLAEPAASDEALLDAGLALLSRIAPGDRPIRAIGMSCAGLLSAGTAPGLFPFHARQHNR
jgi:hypothetical protein